MDASPAPISFDNTEFAFQYKTDEELKKAKWLFSLMSKPWIVKAGVKITYPLTDEAWGQRRFGLTDPNGMYIDVVEQIDPQEGFWEKHKAKN